MKNKFSDFLFRAACLLLAIMWAVKPIYAAPGSDAKSALSVSAKSAVLYDAGGAGVLWEKNAHERLPMASTTKIMTALVALENLPLDTVVSVPAAAVGVEGSSVYLCEGEKQTLEALLFALMLESANDAATAIAIAVAGSVGEFAQLMNRRAESMGLHDTHFVNPHGLDDPEHYTTACDLAVITAEALKDPDFRRIAGTYRTSMPLGDTPGARLLINHNRLLRRPDLPKKAAGALCRQQSVTVFVLLPSHFQLRTTGATTSICSITASTAMKACALQTRVSLNMPYPFRAASRTPCSPQTRAMSASLFPASAARSRYRPSCHELPKLRYSVGTHSAESYGNATARRSRPPTYAPSSTRQNQKNQKNSVFGGGFYRFSD